MLHVHGGSNLLDHLRAAGLPGGFLEWSESLCDGPTPAGLAPVAWRATRAAFLDTAYGRIDGRGALERLVAQDQDLDRAAALEDEIVLWFGPDLFCQAILAALLDRFAATPPAGRLSLVCIGTYPGVDDRRSCTPTFLSAQQLRDVFEHRDPVRPRQLELAREIWTAWRAPTPEPLAALATRDTSALPYLGDGVRRRLEEFPWTTDGLSRVERQALAALAIAERSFNQLFEAAGQAEERRWMTDVMLLHRMRRLATAPTPLVVSVGERPPADPLVPDAARDVPQLRFRLTPAGQEVLEGKRDAIATNGIDTWIGGVHLTGENLWRWNARMRRLEPGPV
jgi:hypothetical protein